MSWDLNEDSIPYIIIKIFIGYYLPDKSGKLAQCIPIYGTILGQCTRNRANAGPIFLVCRVTSSAIAYNCHCIVSSYWPIEVLQSRNIFIKLTRNL